MIRNLRPMSFIFSLLAALLPFDVARAQVAVWDPEEIARLAEKSARMAEATSHAVELVNNINELSRTIGRSGSLQNVDFTHFSVLDELNNIGPNFGAIPSNIPALQNVQIISFNDASAFVKKLTMMPSGGSSVSDSGQIRQASDFLYRKALEDGYALSMQTRVSLSVEPQRALSLVAQASATADLRGDIGANTASAIAVLDQLGGIKAMLASFLEIQTARRIAFSANATTSK
jgi:hypothetical protein